MKKLKYVVICLLLVLVVGCGKEKKYEYTSENTKEKVVVTVKGDYTLSDKEPVKVMSGEEEKATIIFITKENYDQLKELFNNKTLIAMEEGKKGSNEYYLYKVSDDYNFVLLINDSNTGVALTSKSEETTKKLADELSFSK